MKFIRHLPGLRVFYLGSPVGPPINILLSKNGGPFLPPVSRLRSMGRGYYSLAVTREDLDVIGPLAWSVAGFDLISQPQDYCGPLEHGHVNQQALDGAFADLGIGFAPGLGLPELLQRPLYQFLISLE